MELEITDVFENIEACTLSASRNELGDHAGEITWNNALNCEYTLLTDANRQEVIDYFLEFGAWDNEELTGMSNNELNALLLQFIAGDIREYEGFNSFEEYDTSDQTSGRLFIGDDKKVYFHIGN